MSLNDLIFCPICCGTSEVHLEEVFDDRFGCPDLVSIRKCHVCAHRFTSPTLKANQIEFLYEQYYGRSSEIALGPHPSLTRRLRRWIRGENNLGQFCTRPDETKRLLDVGSGDCQNLWDANFLGFDAFGFDVDRTARAVGLAHNLEVRTGSSISDAYPAEDFDWIQLNQVLEHYIDPVDQLQKIARHISPTGKLFISTPNSLSFFSRKIGRAWINWHVPFHQHHFTKSSLHRLLEANGWEIEKTSTVTPLVWAVLQFRRMKISPTRGIPLGYWSPKRRFDRLVEMFLVFLLIFPIRILDSLGLGDSLVVIARRRK